MEGLYGLGGLPGDGWQPVFSTFSSLQQCGQACAPFDNAVAADSTGIPHTAEQNGQKLTFIIVPPRTPTSTSKKRTSTGALLSKRAIPSIFTPHHLARIQAQMGVLDCFERGEHPPQFILDAALCTVTNGPPLALPAAPPDQNTNVECRKLPWMDTILSVAQLPANNGSAIRAKIKQAIKDADGLPLVQRQLKLAIGGNVYKGNNAGTCKQAALQVLALHNPHLAATIQRATYRPPSLPSQLSYKGSDDSADLSPKQMLSGAHSGQLMTSYADDVLTEASPSQDGGLLQLSDSDLAQQHGLSQFPTTACPKYPTEFGEIPGESPEDEQMFYASLQAFLKQKEDILLDGPGWKIPVVAGQKLNICKLYREVCRRGGREKVIQDKGWRAVADKFGVPATLTSASTTMKSYYNKFLSAYEEAFFRPVERASQRSGFSRQCSRNSSNFKRGDSGAFDVQIASSSSLSLHSSSGQLQLQPSGQLQPCPSGQLHKQPSGQLQIPPPSGQLPVQQPSCQLHIQQPSGELQIQSSSQLQLAPGGPLQAASSRPLQTATSGQLQTAPNGQLQAVQSSADTSKTVSHRFTEEEELLVAYGHKKFGSAWSKIQQLLPWRNAQQIKKRWHSAIKDKMSKGKIQVPNEKPEFDLLTIPAAARYLEKGLSVPAEPVAAPPAPALDQEMEETEQDVPYPTLNMMGYSNANGLGNGLPAGTHGGPHAPVLNGDALLHPSTHAADRTQATAALGPMSTLNPSPTVGHIAGQGPADPYRNNAVPTIVGLNPSPFHSPPSGSTAGILFGFSSPMLNSVDLHASIRKPEMFASGPNAFLTSSPMLSLNMMMSSGMTHSLSQGNLHRGALGVVPSLTQLSNHSIAMQPEGLDRRGILDLQAGRMPQSTHHLLGGSTHRPSPLTQSHDARYSSMPPDPQPSPSTMASSGGVPPSAFIHRAHSLPNPNNVGFTPQEAAGLMSQQSMALTSQRSMALSSQQSMALSSQQSMTLSSQQSMALSSQQNFGLTCPQSMGLIQQGLGLASQQSMPGATQQSMALTDHLSMGLTSQPGVGLDLLSYHLLPVQDPLLSSSYPHFHNNALQAIHTEPDKLHTEPTSINMLSSYRSEGLLDGHYGVHAAGVGGPNSCGAYHAAAADATFATAVTSQPHPEDDSYTMGRAASGQVTQQQPEDVMLSGGVGAEFSGFRDALVAGLKENGSDVKLESHLSGYDGGHMLNHRMPHFLSSLGYLQPNGLNHMPGSHLDSMGMAGELYHGLDDAGHHTL